MFFEQFKTLSLGARDGLRLTISYPTLIKNARLSRDDQQNQAVLLSISYSLQLNVRPCAIGSTADATSANEMFFFPEQYNIKLCVICILFLKPYLVVYFPFGRMQA